MIYFTDHFFFLPFLPFLPGAGAFGFTSSAAASTSAPMSVFFSSLAASSPSGPYPSPSAAFSAPPSSGEPACCYTPSGLALSVSSFSSGLVINAGLCYRDYREETSFLPSFPVSILSSGETISVTWSCSTTGLGGSSLGSPIYIIKVS